MNRLHAKCMIAAIVTGIFLFSGPSGARAELVATDKETVLQFCIVDPFKIPWTANCVSGVSLGIVNMADNVSGVQLGILNCGTDYGWKEHSRKVYGELDKPLFQAISGDFCGIQLGCANHVGGKVEGVQLGFLLNTAGQDTWAVQGSLAMNMTSDASDVIQLAVGFNRCDKETRGIQFGAVNVSRGKLSGLQIGLVNRTRTLYGFQIGIWNTVEESSMPYMPILRWSF